MNLAEFTSMTLEEALKKMELRDYKVHTNDRGEVQSVELKYSTSIKERSFK